MAKNTKTETGRETTPDRFPEVTPPAYAQAVGATYLVESMMQMQKSLGELTATVGHLKGSVDKQGSKLDRISHVLFAAGVVLALLLSIGGFFLNKIWDGVVNLMTTQAQIQTQIVPKNTALPPVQPAPKSDQIRPPQ